jgi:ABC-type nitrate/sulfonate/bicarbonate transport system substrate-binding protein
MRSRHIITSFVVAATVFAACGSDDAPAPTEGSVAPTESDAPANGGDIDVVAGEAFPEARCEANEAAGTVTYLTGFDFAAAASIVDILVAADAGYYEDLCLTVDIKPGSSIDNYPLIANNNAQFASGGSFSEVATFATANDAEFIVTAVEGRTAIDSLIIKPDQNVTSLEDLAGTTIGVKFKIPPSVEAMLLQAGLTIDEDYQTVPVEGFDPLAHIAIEPIVGFPGYKSNEPGALERAGVEFDLFDPLDFDVPGSFGVIYTNAAFVADHPTAAEDFMRATMLGLADALVDPDSAAQVAIDLINSNGNPMFLQPDGEVFRWNTDAALIQATTPDGVGYGVPDSAQLQAELDAYAAPRKYLSSPSKVLITSSRGSYLKPVSNFHSKEQSTVAGSHRNPTV